MVSTSTTAAQASSKSPRNTVHDILAELHKITVDQPKKKTAISIYTKRYYQNRLKVEFDIKWAKVKDTFGPDTRVSMCNAYVREAWKKENEELRDAIEKEAEDTYQEELKKYRECNRHFMQDGEVGLRSAHSTVVGGCTTKFWPKVDHNGFMVAEKSITAYGRKFFSPEDCTACKVVPKGEFDDLFNMSDETKEPGAAQNKVLTEGVPKLLSMTPAMVSSDSIDPTFSKVIVLGASNNSGQSGNK
ncbi:hypothetical protein DXG01_014665 [Tephrocybe rancida]|nr:hypothetical protein DXG01_014665 [Tephrocybe rancida]